MRFYQSHTYYLSHTSRTWLWDARVARLERQQIGSPTSLVCLMRPCCAETHSTHENHASHRVYNTVRCQGGKPSWLHTYIDFSNFCHFLRNKDSRYCFFSCNRCSFQLKRGHLSTFRAYLIFLHRASKALSRAANSFMLVSWSRLLRNIHS